MTSQSAGLISALCTDLTAEAKVAVARAVRPVALDLQAGVKRGTPPPVRVDRIGDRVMSEDAAVKKLGRRRFATLEKAGMLRFAQQGQARTVRMSGKRGPTGQLKASWLIEFSGDGAMGEVFNTRQYAPFVNYGTGTRGASAAHAALPEGYSHGSKPGMVAQDMTTEPVRAAETALHARLEDELSRLGEKVLT
jgi:hypothetical protein